MGSSACQRRKGGDRCGLKAAGHAASVCRPPACTHCATAAAADLVGELQGLCRSRLWLHRPCDALYLKAECQPLPAAPSCQAWLTSEVWVPSERKALQLAGRDGYWLAR